MSSRFLRENSQFIAASLLATYTGSFFVYRALYGMIYRDDYEFKTKKNVYMDLSVKETDELKKMLYRLPPNSSRKVDFIRTNTMDFVSFGFCNIRQGATIGLPVGYFANNLAEISQFSPPTGYQNVMGQSISNHDISYKLGKGNEEEFFGTLILNQDAKLFGIARELISVDNFFYSIMDKLSEAVVFSVAYWYAFRKARISKLQFKQRRIVYFYSTLLALILIITSRPYIQKFIDRNNDVGACRLGLDCSEGSIEYYDKLIERNKILRKVLVDGEKLVDANGNYLARTLKIPFTHYYFYIPYNGMKLTSRRELCKNELAKIVIELTMLAEKKALNNQEDSKLQGEKIEENNKELAIFKNLRIFLESKIKPAEK